MCARITMLTFEEVEAAAEAVERRLIPRALVNANEDAPRAQAFPGGSIPVIAPSAQGELGITQATWGFVAEWNKKLVFNTRIESILNGAAMWHEAAKTGRCIVPAASFFEPHATETIPSPRTGRPMKRPYEFADPASIPLLLAGIQAQGRCSIVTCEPNSWVSPIHNRMPLVMRFQEALTWLSPDWPTLADRTALELLVQPEHLRQTAQAQQSEPSDQLSLF